MIQNNAIRFISNVKGRESITAAREKLGIKSLEDRRKDTRLTLLMKILSKETCHSALSEAYDELMNVNRTVVTTRSAVRGEPTSIYASTKSYHNSFLPRTVRDLHAKTSNQ